MVIIIIINLIVVSDRHDEGTNDNKFQTQTLMNIFI